MLARIAEPQGNDPAIKIGVDWVPGTTIYYTDRGLNGRILEIGNLNSVLRTDGSGPSDSVSIKLDDTDGVLKTIYDGWDIHKRRVVIYQGFMIDGELSATFPVFEGEITSPITWSEGERTLSFSVSSKVEDREVGFSPEEGQFDNLPLDLIGKAWPLAIGTVRYIPAVPLREPPTSVLYTAFGIPDPGILEQIARLEKQGSAPIERPLLQNILDAGISIEERNAIMKSNAQAMESFRETMRTSVNSVWQQIEELRAIFVDQEKWLPRNKQLLVTMDNIDPGSYVIKINDTVLKATFTRIPDSLLGYMTVKVPPVQLYDKEDYRLTRMNDLDDNWFGARNADGFSFFGPGTQISVLSPFPIFHVVSCTPGTILGVYAYRNYDGIRKLTTVPEKYYTITPDYLSATAIDSGYDDGNPNANTQDKTEWFHPIGITLDRPLSTTSYLIQRKKIELREHLQDLIEKYDADVPAKGSKIEHIEEWEDQLYVSIATDIGPNPVDIIEWIILNFSSHGVDTSSFDVARPLLANYPMNFALFEKRNLIQLLNEIAIQARCALWIREYTFYIRYLSAEPEPVDTITDNDIEFQSLQLGSTETEQLVTKYIASFRPNYLPETKENKCILRLNIPKYGVQEEIVDYFAYQAHYAVKKSATFWLIRKANTWKKITFRTFLHKLNLETMDCVTVDLSLANIANSPVKGIVESAIYSSSNNTIEMTIWLPVLLGTMEPYNFAWPANISETDIFPGAFDITTASGGGFVAYSPKVLSKRAGGSVSDTGPPGHNSDNLNDHKRAIDSIGRPDTLGTRNPSDAADSLIATNYFSDLINPEITATPTWDYVLRDAAIPPPDMYLKSPGGANAFPGFVISGSGSSYSVRMYRHGLDADSETVSATQLQITSSEQLPAETAVIVVEITSIPEENQESQKFYYIQAPVWLG